MVNDEMGNDEGLFHKVAAWLGLRAAELRGPQRWDEERLHDDR